MPSSLRVRGFVSRYREIFRLRCSDTRNVSRLGIKIRGPGSFLFPRFYWKRLPPGAGIQMLAAAYDPTDSRNFISLFSSSSVFQRDTICSRIFLFFGFFQFFYSLPRAMPIVENRYLRYSIEFRERSNRLFRLVYLQILYLFRFSSSGDIISTLSR